MQEKGKGGASTKAERPWACDVMAMWRLANSGTATYLSYWSLYLALQRAFNGR